MHPEYDFFSIFVEGLSNFEIIVAAIGFVSAAAFAGFWATKFGHMVLPHPRESRVADFMPFEKLLSDGMTIRCYNGSLARIFRVTGADLAFATEEKVASMFEARKSWIDGMSDLQVVCRVITVRERVPLEENVGDFNNPLLEKISDIWQENINRIFFNTHYIVLSVADRDNNLKDLNYASQSLTATMNDYGIRPLIEEEGSAPEDSPFSVYSKICSPVSRPMPKVHGATGAQLNELLTADHIHFTGEEGLIKFFSGDKEMYEIVMGIRSSGDYMDEAMVESLLSLDCELVLLHNIQPIFKPKARALLMQQQRMATMTSFSSDVVDQYGAVLASIEDSDTGHQSLTQYAMAILLRGQTKEEIDFAEGEVQRI